MASIFDHYNLAFDRMFPLDRVPENRLTPPSDPEDTRSPEEMRTLVAEYLDTNAVDPESIMHMAESKTGDREMAFKSFREAAANAIDLESEEAYQRLGRLAAEIVFLSVRREL